MTQPDITVYFLNASRAIRIPWILEELGLPYRLVTANRDSNNLAPAHFRERIPAPLKKSPTITDGDLVIQESGAIVDYLIETYDTEGKLQSKTDPRVRSKTREWVHASEGTFMLHACAVLYARWMMPETARSCLPEMEEKLSKNVRNDLDWIESHLKEQGTKFLVGDTVSAADIMMQFGIEFLFALKLGVSAEETSEGGCGGLYPETKKWLERCMSQDSFKRAVLKSGYTLNTTE